MNRNEKLGTVRSSVRAVSGRCSIARVERDPLTKILSLSLSVQQPPTHEECLRPTDVGKSKVKVSLNADIIIIITFTASLSERRRYCGVRRLCVCVSVHARRCPPSRDCRRVTLVSAAKVMRCI